MLQDLLTAATREPGFTPSCLTLQMMLSISFTAWLQAPVLSFHILLAHIPQQHLQLSSFRAGPGHQMIHPSWDRHVVPVNENTRQKQRSISVSDPGLEEPKFLVPRKTPFLQRLFGGYWVGRQRPGLQKDQVPGLTCASLCCESTKGQLRKICTHQQG